MALASFRKAFASQSRSFSSSSTNFAFQASNVIVNRTKAPRQKLPPAELKFGASFTDHWLKVEWNEKKGWSAPLIEPYGSITLDPSALCFEGMKAYVDKDGKTRMFRPMDNMRRLSSSSKRLALPAFPEEEFLKSIQKLVLLDKDWIPRQQGYSLYLRPTMIATTPLLGVSPPKDALLYVIMSPVGPYYPTGFKPVSLLADTVHVRAWPGGAGGYKIGANYAPTIQPAMEASKKGFQQILWLLDDYVTEVGTMNLFCFWKNEKGEKELITAPLDGTILPGVTRSSIIELSQQWGEFKVTERKWTITELIKALKENRVYEVFGAGTAAVVSPVANFEYKGVNYKVPCKDNVAGELTQRFLKSITDIQYGITPSPWSVVID